MSHREVFSSNHPKERTMIAGIVFLSLFAIAAVIGGVASIRTARVDGYGSVLPRR